MITVLNNKSEEVTLYNTFADRSGEQPRLYFQDRKMWKKPTASWLEKYGLTVSEEVLDEDGRVRYYLEHEYTIQCGRSGRVGKTSPRAPKTSNPLAQAIIGLAPKCDRWNLLWTIEEYYPEAIATAAKNDSSSIQLLLVGEIESSIGLRLPEVVTRIISETPASTLRKMFEEYYPEEMSDLVRFYKDEMKFEHVCRLLCAEVAKDNDTDRLTSVLRSVTTSCSVALKEAEATATEATATEATTTEATTTEATTTEATATEATAKKATAKKATAKKATAKKATAKKATAKK